MLVGLVTAGCGGTGRPSTKAEYQAKVEQTVERISKQLGSSAGSDIDTLTNRDLTTVYWAFRNLAAGLNGIRPPAEVADLHPRLVGAIRDLADEFPNLARTVQHTKDPDAAFAALFGAKAIQELGVLDQAFKARGYDLEING